MSAAPSQTDEAAFLGGRISLRQPVKGYRAGLDAALLAAALDASPGDRALELGCGAGAALLSAGVLYPEADFLGLEREDAAFALACANVERNRLSQRVRVEQADALSWKVERDFDAVFLNPPWYEPGEIREPPPGRKAAWIADAGGSAWIDAALKALRPKGVLTLIHRADALPLALSALQGRAGAVCVRPVQPRSESPATRVLVRAVKGARTPLTLLSPFILHPDGPTSDYTQDAEAVLRGQAGLVMRG
ncbi:MAG: methyltransferase [Pseudomonadota bacterium]